ncbi:MAG TPA: hypothetical protein VJ890_17000 [Vineibacter sp.]|nr:hypothetical protein [Vineibacter sp.]
MRYVNGVIWLLLTLVLGGSLAAQPADSGAANAAKAFYDAYIRLKPLGVPDAAQRAQLRSLISPALHDLLAAADAAEARHAQKTRKQEPPLVQNDLFTSLFEGASRFEVGACSADASDASCLIDFVYQDTKGGPETKWQDRVHLLKAATGWLLDDVEYRGSWALAARGRLSETLKAVVREADK